MTANPWESTPPVLAPKDRIIVALDVDGADAASEIVSELDGKVGAFKIGLQLFLAAGPAFVQKMTEAGTKIFLDLKFYDIPNTVAKTSIEAAKMGVWMFNVHASGGREMMVRTKADVADACAQANIPMPLIIAVTVLTSSDQQTLNEIGVERPVEDQVAALAKLTYESGLDGVVASPQEVSAIRRTVVNPEFLTVTPGIRPISATLDDQKRVTTFGQALANGSDYVVIGRPITKAKDRFAAVDDILSEVGH
ncbi:MAG TPA: orotidine-5'-phosphate decarboxylase [Pyrinomonadaceae bacterium]|nr:orotidine-5'-phosphate decarboxylase [Acidobacteriota bacterium]HQZ96626.1 orotidine-5'-phosphate decarboxylase [Pyrinomonadaceae bacterium]